MIPRIKNYQALDNYMLYVEFDDGYKVMYDVMDDIKTCLQFVRCWMFVAYLSKAS